LGDPSENIPPRRWPRRPARSGRAAHAGNRRRPVLSSTAAIVRVSGRVPDVPRLQGPKAQRQRLCRRGLTASGDPGNILGKQRQPVGASSWECGSSCLPMGASRGAATGMQRFPSESFTSACVRMYGACGPRYAVVGGCWFPAGAVGSNDRSAFNPMIDGRLRTKVGAVTSYFLFRVV